MAVTEILEVEQKVHPENIDELGHVNNEVYLHWLMKAATFHGEIVGFGTKKLVDRGEGWVVRNHFIEYLAQVKLGDSIVIRTWIETDDKITSERQYELINTETGKVVCKGKTLWVWINYKTGRIARIPQELKDAFRAWKQTDSVKEAWQHYSTAVRARD